MSKLTKKPSTSCKGCEFKNGSECDKKYSLKASQSCTVPESVIFVKGK